MSVFIVVFSIMMKLIPHIPNFSPEIVLALYLGMKYPAKVSFLAIFVIALISDLILGWQSALFSSFGNWTIFTYSGLFAIGTAGIYIRKQGFGKIFLGTSCVITLTYWLWTNFGTWLMAGLYPHTSTGFMTCYTLALPFLANSLAASIAWCAIIMLCENYFSKKRVLEAV